MSIIQDALKKVENSREEPKRFADAPVKPVLEVPARPGNKKVKTFIPAAIFAILFISIIVVLRQSPVTAVKDAASRVGAAHESMLKPIIAEPYVRPDYSLMAVVKKPSLDGFVLSGIMQLTDGPRAIVNNIMVGIGDTVSGAVVKEIHKNNIVLQVKDSEFTLDMRG